MSVILRLAVIQLLLPLLLYATSCLKSPLNEVEGRLATRHYFYIANGKPNTVKGLTIAKARNVQVDHDLPSWQGTGCLNL